MLLLLLLPRHHHRHHRHHHNHYYFQHERDLIHDIAHDIDVAIDRADIFTREVGNLITYQTLHGEVQV